MNVLQRVAGKHRIQPVQLRYLKPTPVPFSAAGIIAVLACPALLLLDIFSGAHVMIGAFYLIVLTLLGNQRRSLIALYATVASLMLFIDLRMFYGQGGTQLAIADKLIALLALPVIASGLIYQRTSHMRALKRKPLCSVKVILPPAERIALNGESKNVFGHLRRSSEPIDQYTRELIWFVYMKSPKN